LSENSTGRASQEDAAVSSRIAPVYLIPLLGAIQRAGIAFDGLFHGLGLVADDLDVPGFAISPKEANTVVRRALRLLNVADLGLTLGERTRITERGALALGLMAAATLGDAIALKLQFPGSAGYLMAVHAEQDQHSHMMVAEPAFDNDDIAPFLVDIMFAGSVQIRRHVTDRHYAPTRVEFVRPRPPNSAAYEHHFRCPVHFGRGRNVLATDLHGLEQALPMANAMAYRLSRQLLEIAAHGADSHSALGMAVERTIRRALPLIVSPADLARSLNMGERNLRRKLSEQGLSFRSLVDESRKARALELMAGSRRSITEIALLTGFSDVRAFSRAFKRWVGKPPSAALTAVHSPDLDTREDADS
jgi:AraC-like DNA-binding protein